jgi:16S rRNA (guanine1207-N2)-methyltransferase
VAAFARSAPLALPGCAPRTWRTFPGLFAEGGVDVMTRALLAALPAFPERARVLDFCAGSGVVAAALLARQPSLRVTLADADALAVEAAAANVPAARRVLLADCWPAPGGRRWHAVVSNPPVHAGVEDDLRVLRALLAGAPGRLKPGGALFIVAQLHVPVGALAGAVEGLRSATATQVEGGRFLVWKAEAA